VRLQNSPSGRVSLSGLERAVYQSCNTAQAIFLTHEGSVSADMANYRDKRPQRKQWQRQAPVLLDTSQRPLDIVEDASALPAVQIDTDFPHPNVYRKRVRDIPGNAKPGDLVSISHLDGRHLGYGYLNSSAGIGLRFIRWGAEPPNAEFWDQLLARAVAFRSDTLKLDEATTACRLIHAEGDFLPGIVVDRYNDVLSLEAYSLAMFQRAQSIAERLAAICGTEHWIVKPSPQSETQEGFSAPIISSPDLPRTTTIHEYGTRFRISFSEGHKTGFFCDQRENRLKLAKFCEGQSVADICCYTGGFAIQAKKAGKAADVTGVELDENPLQLAKSNANLNQAKVSFVQADAFAWMRDMVRNGRQFDVLALDPPKLIHSREEIEEGRRTHFDLNRLALQLVRPGGIMVTFTCAGLLSTEEFDKLVRSAARQAGPPFPGTESDENPRHQPREIQIFDRTGASADHPVAGSCPESDYLRALWMRVL
jgi:23S rRNA (cytosine1962-C5)-methyltransferase